MNQSIFIADILYTSTMDETTKLDDHDMRQMQRMRRIAFVATAVSTTAVLACVIGMPMLYEAMQHVQSSMDDQLGVCRVRFCSSSRLVIGH